MKKTILALTIAAGFTSFAGNAKAQVLYYSSFDLGTISTISTNGTVSTFASGFNHPYGLAFDSLNNLFVADIGNNRISKITPSGTVSTFASGLSTPVSITIDALDNLFVSNFGNNSISKITSAGNVSTFASGGL